MTTAPAPRTQPGFTLLEMLVVLGMIATLSLIALPSYLDRIVRQQIEAALPLAEVAKGPIGAAWALTQAFPADNAAAGLPVADKIVGNFVSSVSVEAGAIHVSFGNRANTALQGKLLTLRAAVVEDAPVVPLAWVCGHAEAVEKMTAKGTDRTTVPTKFLPLNCLAKKQ